MSWQSDKKKRFYKNSTKNSNCIPTPVWAASPLNNVKRLFKGEAYCLTGFGIFT
ncbi:MAG: hypothetical protein LBK06_10070 [Planctomycetaceae bacterium]|nr:hypothetical protein [Planctomycetaceae bacterium]